MLKRALLILPLCLSLLLCACKGGGGRAAQTTAPTAAPGAAQAQFSEVAVAILLPGVEGENPIFQKYVAGIRQACAELGAPAPKVVEGGDDYNSYGKYLVSLAESGLYDVLFTCTNTMCYHVAELSRAYPAQKTVILDGDMNAYFSTLPEGRIPDNVYGVAFDKYEQGYLGGVFCALVTKSAMPRANDALAVGLVFTDVYDSWEIDLKTGFLNGVRDVDPQIEVLRSVIGDWVDPQKGADVTRALLTQGVDIVYYTTGASAYGCVTEAAAQQRYAVGSDHNAISLDPDTIVGCTVVAGDEIAYQTALAAIKGTLAYGSCPEAGAAEGAITFTFDDPVYIQSVPEDIRARMEAAYAGLIDGSIDPHRALD